MDSFLFYAINQLAGKWAWLDVLGIFFGRYFGFFLIFLLFLLLIKKTRKYWKMIFQALVSAILAKEIIVDIIRWLWERPRPFVADQVNLLISREAIPSFPSGHAAFYFAISTIVYFYNKRLGVLFFVGGFLISLGRVFVGFHWPTDILVGAIIGILSGWFIHIVFRKIFKKE